MGSEAELEACSLPKLALFSIPPMQSPVHSGMLTPPLHTSASVPFRWEEEPGKPRPCTALITLPPNNNGPKCLELPPRLLMESKITKTPSPTTVLDGPDEDKSIFSSSSFRFIRKFEGSFNSTVSSPERGQLGTIVLGKRSGNKTRRGFFGSWRLKTLKGSSGNKHVGGDSFVFPSSIDVADHCNIDDDQCGSTTRVKRARIRSNGSFSTLSQARSHFWAASCSAGIARSESAVG
ncbi:unnamed protein product, partial [Ilex paraguariensis]